MSFIHSIFLFILWGFWRKEIHEGGKTPTAFFMGSYLLHPKTFHPRTLILNFSSLHFIPSKSSFLFNPLDFSFTNSSPTFYPTPCNPFQIICYISYPLNSYSSKWDLLFHTFNLIHNISSSSNQSLDFISLT